MCQFLHALYDYDYNYVVLDYDYNSLFTMDCHNDFFLLFSEVFSTWLSLYMFKLIVHLGKICWERVWLKVRGSKWKDREKIGGGLKIEAKMFILALLFKYSLLVPWYFKNLIQV